MRLSVHLSVCLSRIFLLRAQREKAGECPFAVLQHPCAVLCAQDNAGRDAQLASEPCLPLLR